MPGDTISLCYAALTSMLLVSTLRKRVRPHGAVVALLIPVQKVVRSNRAAVMLFVLHCP